MTEAVTGLSGQQFSRRQVGLFGAAAGLMGAGMGTVAGAAAPQIATRRVAVTTPAGALSGQFHAAADRAMPGMVVWAKPGRATDIAVAQLAATGWAVLVLDAQGHSVQPQALNEQAKAATTWLAQQEGVAGTAANRGSLGNGYTLRTVTAARPRFSLASASQRTAAAQASLLCAMPANAKFAAHQATLADAAYMVTVAA